MMREFPPAREKKHIHTYQHTASDKIFSAFLDHA